MRGYICFLTLFMCLLSVNTMGLNQQKKMDSKPPLKSLKKFFRPWSENKYDRLPWSICPMVSCPDDIPEVCRKAEFTIAKDGKTSCRVCDTNLCGPMYEVCPQVECPGVWNIPPYCQEEQNMIGMDGITVCPICPRDRCKRWDNNRP